VYLSYTFHEFRWMEGGDLQATLVGEQLQT
jgi:hypothetical protein